MLCQSASLREGPPPSFSIPCMSGHSPHLPSPPRLPDSLSYAPCSATHSMHGQNAQGSPFKSPLPAKKVPNYCIGTMTALVSWSLISENHMSVTHTESAQSLHFLSLQATAQLLCQFTLCNVSQDREGGLVHFSSAVY